MYYFYNRLYILHSLFAIFSLEIHCVYKTIGVKTARGRKKQFSLVHVTKLKSTQAKTHDFDFLRAKSLA